MLVMSFCRAVILLDCMKRLGMFSSFSEWLINHGGAVREEVGPEPYYVFFHQRQMHFLW